MKKAFFLYLQFWFVSSVCAAAIGMFVPPVWAKCDCTFNDVKSMLIFPISMVAGAAVVYLTHHHIREGAPHKKAFLRSLAIVSVLYAVLGIGNAVMFG